MITNSWSELIVCLCHIELTQLWQVMKLINYFYNDYNKVETCSILCTFCTFYKSKHHYLPFVFLSNAKKNMTNILLIIFCSFATTNWLLIIRQTRYFVNKLFIVSYFRLILWIILFTIINVCMEGWQTFIMITLSLSLMMRFYQFTKIDFINLWK